jgi:hypothetical protein
MCIFKAERIIKETLSKVHCRFISMNLEDELLIVRFIDIRGEYQKAILPYRFMSEYEIENKVMESVF